MDGDIPKGGVWNIKENSISNLVRLNQNWIVRTFFQFICQQTKNRLMPNQSKKYN